MVNPTPPEPSPENETGPEPFIGFAHLMRLALAGVDLKPLGAHLVERATNDPDDANGLMDLSLVLQLTGNREIALATQAQALQMQQLYRHPATTPEAGLKLLAIMGPGDLMANTPIECLLEQSDVALDMLYIGPDLPVPTELPEHDVVFIALGESDENQPLLAMLQTLAQAWTRPVLNRPERIAQLTRDGACTLLQSAPGMVMPVSLRIDRATLEQIGQHSLPISTLLPDGSFPIIVRPVGSHAGQSLDKLDNPDAIADYLQAVPEQEFYIARFVDYRSADGLFRKYRIILIEGHPYICHMAISQHWMVHYLNAGMADSVEKREEEARFMAGFDTGFAPRHAPAFEAITQHIPLDYVGIDCAETMDGKLLIFEIDSDMIVHAMDPIDLYPYKQPQMQKIFTAFRAMLANATQRSLT